MGCRTVPCNRADLGVSRHLPSVPPVMEGNYRFADLWCFQGGRSKWLNLRRLQHCAESMAKHSLRSFIQIPRAERDNGASR